MKIADFFIKSLAVMLVAGGVSIAFLRETLTDVEIEKQSPAIFVKSENASKRNLKSIPKSIIEKCQKAALTRENSDIPFLCKGIEYNVLLDDETIVFYNSNQTLEYDAVHGICVKYNYVCPIGEKAYNGKEFFEKAECDAMQAFVSRTDTKIVKIEIVDENHKTVTFRIVTDMGEDLAILISYRLDTGSCIYFDGEKAASLLK